jgi:hypothetical protein
MEEMLARLWNGLVARVGGPMTFRVILQPSMATLLAVLAGLKDAREGRPPYLWTILTDPSQRAGLIREGWKACARVFFLAIIIEVIYQWYVQRWVYPGELIVVAIVLALVPYLVIRGPVNRVARRLVRREVNSAQ